MTPSGSPTPTLAPCDEPQGSTLTPCGIPLGTTLSPSSTPSATLTPCSRLSPASFKPTDKVDDYIIIDTGASAGIGNANEDYGAHQDISNGPIVEFADGSSNQVTSPDILPISSLPPGTCGINKFDGGKTLLAIQRACDSGIDFLFQSKNVTAIEKYGNRTTVGVRHPTLNLWVIPKDSAPLPRLPLKYTHGLKAFGAGVHTYEVKSFRSLINFYHKTCCFLPTSIWIDAINKGYFVGLPGLTADRVKKFCTPKEETAKGHMRQLPSNIRSTQKDLMPLPQQKPKSNVRRIGAIAFDETQIKNMIGVDFMGRYPTESRDGNKYILIMYDYDTNYIRGFPVVSRKAEVYLKAFQTMFDDLTAK